MTIQSELLGPFKWELYYSNVTRKFHVCICGGGEVAAESLETLVPEAKS